MNDENDENQKMIEEFMTVLTSLQLTEDKKNKALEKFEHKNEDGKKKMIVSFQDALQKQTNAYKRFDTMLKILKLNKTEEDDERKTFENANLAQKEILIENLRDKFYTKSITPNKTKKNPSLHKQILQAEKEGANAGIMSPYKKSSSPGGKGTQWRKQGDNPRNS